MTNITLSIEDGIYNKMRKFSDIRWSEFVRMCIHKRIKELESIKSNIFADEDLLAENWLSGEDTLAWENL